MSEYKENKTERILTDADVSEVREKIKPYLWDKRYLHTLEVEREAVKIGEIYLPDRINELRVSALLHDITKKADLKKQLQYCEEFGIMIDAKDLCSPAVFHAKTAAHLASRDFADYVSGDIISGIRWHTTGHDGMSVFEAVIYLADFIEDTRDFEDCVKLRNYFYGKLATGEDKDSVLVDTMIYSFDLTISLLMADGAVIDDDTVRARNYYLVTRLKNNG